jgi:hypothetical protein
LQTLSGYILSHWQGRLPLGLILLINILALRVALSALTPLIPATVGPVLMLGLLTVNAGVLVWQAVGGLRWVDARIKSSGDMVVIWAVYSGLIIVGLMAAVQMLDVVLRLTSLNPPQPAYQIKTVELPLSRDGKQVSISGRIDFLQNSALIRLISEAENLQLVILDSDGGSVFAGRALARNIEQAGLNTYVGGKCFSACTIAFMAGTRRKLGENGRLGFHSYRFDSANRVQTLDVEAAEAKDRAFFSRRGVSGAFLDRVFDMPPGELWIPTRAELLEFGIISPD